MKENTVDLGPVHLGLAHVRQCLSSAGPWKEAGKGWRGSDPERGGPLAWVGGGGWEAHVVKETSHSKELAEALVYQEREQTALMAFLHGKEEKEAEALARLRQMAPISPWPKEHSMDDIEKTWNQWVKDKQVGRVGGG